MAESRREERHVVTGYSCSALWTPAVMQTICSSMSAVTGFIWVVGRGSLMYSPFRARATSGSIAFQPL